MADVPHIDMQILQTALTLTGAILAERCTENKQCPFSGVTSHSSILRKAAVE